MKILKLLFLSAIISLTLFSCSCKDEETEELLGNWIDLSDFEGVARNDAVSFTIGDLGYVGTGYDGEIRLKDFWSYNSSTNYWTQVADLPGEARNAAVAFAVGGKGYVGTGYNGISKLSDFWAYDPSTNSWEQKADFADCGGTARYGAVAMSIGNIGYIGTGYDGNYLKDFWAYYPELDTFRAKVSVAGSKRRDAVAFVVNNKGYICTGYNNGTYENDLLEYDPATGLWTQKRKIANVSDDSYDDTYTITRSNAVAFVIGAKAYITTGGSPTAQNDTWEYDPLQDLWSLKTSFEGIARIDAVAFSINDNAKGFVTTGRSGSNQLDDIWEFKPNDEYNNLD